MSPNSIRPLLLLLLMLIVALRVDATPSPIVLDTDSFSDWSSLSEASLASNEDSSSSAFLREEKKEVHEEKESYGEVDQLPIAPPILEARAFSDTLPIARPAIRRDQGGIQEPGGAVVLPINIPAAPVVAAAAAHDSSTSISD